MYDNTMDTSHELDPTTKNNSAPVTVFENELKETYGIAGFIDVETTGLNPHVDEIIELALYLFAFHRESGEIKCIVDGYTGLREPKAPISAGAYRVHGIGPDDVAGKQLDMARLEGMIGRAEFLVAHNATFDQGFVTRLIPKSRTKQWFCSMRGVDWRAKGMASKALQYILEAHQIKVEQAHRAGSDVKAAIALLAKPCGGKTYFYELLRRYGVGEQVAAATEFGE